MAETDSIARIKSCQATVTVAGLGYVGLPLATALAKAGFTVVGIDPDKHKVEEINSGRSYVSDVSSDELGPLVQSGRITATTDYQPVTESDAAIICVPTPFGRAKQPDLSYITGAAEGIAYYLPGAVLSGRRPLIVLESTTYPGTTEDIVLPILEGGRLKHGRDFLLAFSPERIDPGNPRFTVSNTPKVVGGVTPEATEVACALYASVTSQVVPVSSPRVAEMAKLYENVFRHVNIALANEMCILCQDMGIDVWEVIDAAATKPFGFMPFYPGPGVGGHCIPVDPFYLTWKLTELDRKARFVELAGEINDRMPYWVVDRLQNALNDRQKSIKGCNVLVLGVAYKRDIGDIRESPALKVIEYLVKKGANVRYHDPYVPSVRSAAGDLTSVPLTEDELGASDAVVILTDHSCIPYDTVVNSGVLVLDTRNVLRSCKTPNVVRL
ncbi:MAG: nucleotide sugar dehydrogenase [Armatimonadota bacterium]